MRELCDEITTNIYSITFLRIDRDTDCAVYSEINNDIRGSLLYEYILSIKFEVLK